MAAGCRNGINRWNETSESWSTFKNAHAAGTGLFEDQSFGAVQSSLYNTSFLSDMADADDMKKAIEGWARPSEMGFEGKPSFWGPTGQPIPEGVHQQNLGDCWFLASASALAEVPIRLKRTVWNDSYDEKGAFRFFFWVKNKWESINIDDRLPAKKDYISNKWMPWMTTRSKQGAWWMPLMEKAYAKLDQNYERIIAGMGYEGLRTLTGMPTVYIKLNRGADLDASWNTLKPLTGKNYPMTTPCCNGAGVDGLVTGHAYTLLDLV